MRAATLIAILAVGVVGCKPASQENNVAATADTTHMGGMSAMQHDSMGNMPMQPGVMTDAQHDSMMQAMKHLPGDVQFMAMMINHHTGLIEMAKQASTRATDDSVKATARNLQMKQQQENEQMQTMMRGMGGPQQYMPMMMAKNKAQLDSLSAKSGKDYDKYFLQAIIKHHQDGIAMVDEFMPRMKEGQSKQMAERMKTDQQKEVRQLQGKLKTL